MKLIVEMEMKKNCHECDAKCVSALYGRICGITRKNIMPFLDKPNRPDWCPIKGVLPEEHGDLIDRDALLEMCIYYDINPNKGAVDADNIQDMPVIIAAERKDDDKTRSDTDA